MNKTKKCSDAILCTGFPVNTNFNEENIRKYVNDIINFKKVRLLGSAALSLAYLASGKVDAYYEKDIKIWDVAAGIAIVKGAGGIIKNTKYNNDFLLDVYAECNKLT